MLAGTALITYSGCVHPRESERGYYAFGSDRRVVGTPATDHRFTGQKVDGSGLYYYNARYYDPVIGQFVSPDTIVPEPGRVFAYNRYMYVMGNPLRFSDPSGHYSNDEIMQHYGCNDWACVESHYQAGGSHEGLWGWLYMLQQAQDGDGVVASSIGGGGQVQFSGSFVRSANGAIRVGGTRFDFQGVGGATSSAISAVFAEQQFAGIATHFGRGSYELSGAGRYVSTASTTKHNGLSFDPSQVDKQGLALAAMSAGTDLGPIIMAAAPMTGPAAPFVLAGGLAYTLIGVSTDLVVDVIIPVNEALHGNTGPALTTIGVEMSAVGLQYAGGQIGRRIAPAIGPAYDVGNSLAPAICFGTGCR